MKRAWSATSDGRLLNATKIDRLHTDMHPVSVLIWNAMLAYNIWCSLTFKGKQCTQASCSHSPNEFHAENLAAMLTIVDTDLCKRSAGNKNFGAYADDMLLEQRNQDDGVHAVCPLQKTFVGNVFRKALTQWVACMYMCCASM